LIQRNKKNGKEWKRMTGSAHKKPYIHIDLNRLSTKEAARVVNKWIQRHRPKVLNVVGERASKDPKIYQATLDVLELVNRLDRRAMMTKKVLVLLGSPRKKGNSAILAEQIAKGAKTAKAKVETIYLHGKKIAPCKACFACQKKNSKGCSIQDDMQELYPKLIEADAWVIASPVYWFTVSAQTKIFMDRCFALPAYRNDPFKGKRIAIAMAYGGDDPFDSGCVNALRTFQDAFTYTESDIIGMVYGSAMDAGEIKANQKVMQEAMELGKKLASGG
jgi:multimeric flavodoxin WrbA